MKKNQFGIFLTLLLILTEIILGVFKDVIVETLPGKEFLDKYNINIVTVLAVLIGVVILLVIVEFFEEKEEHKLSSQDDEHIIKYEQQSRIRRKLIQNIKPEVHSR